MRQLVSEPQNSVRVLDDLSVGQIRNLELAENVSATKLPAKSLPDWRADEVHVCVGDIRDPGTFHEVATGSDIIIHLAANSGVLQSTEDPVTDCQTNILGTLNGLEAARHHKIRRFVLASSGATLGTAAAPFDENRLPQPTTPYGASKLGGENYCRVYAATFGLDTVSLRFSNVYGPGSGHKGSVIATFLKQALAGAPLTIEGDGMQSRDFLYLGDLLQAIRLASLREGVAGEVFHVASGIETRILDLAAMIMDVLSASGMTNVSAKHVDPRPGDLARSFANIEKIHKLLGWAPRTGLAEGIRMTVEWFLHAPGSTSPAASPV